MKKIILALILITISLPIFSQSSAGRFSLKDIDTYWESSIKVTPSYWIPKFRPFGTSTTFTDSTNYVTLNKSLYVLDSMKVARDLYLGVKGGVLYLDTLRDGKIFYNGTTFTVQNNKVSTMLLSSIGGLKLLNNTGTTDKMFFESYGMIDFQDANNAGIVLRNDNGDTLRLGTGSVSVNQTGQIKLPSDTASNYTSSDTITINRQSGTITTKSLTTASDDFYTFYLKNSLISSTSKVFLSYCGGTENAGRPMVYRVVSASGLATCIVLNLTGAGSFNGNIKFNFIVFN